MADVNTLKFAKLNGSNYRSWSFNMRLYLESHDLFEHTDGTAETPTEDADAEVRRKFVSSAKKAWTYICLAIEPEYQIHVRDTNTAKEAWDALKRQFARESLLQKVRLRQQYYSLRFHPGNDMMEHVSQLKSLHDQLKEMNVSIDDKELAMTLLASLPEEFKPLITALDAVGDENLSYDKVKNMLLNDVERSVNTKAKENAYTVRGKYMKGKSNNNEKNGMVFRGKCHNCKEVGHFARDCPKRNMKSGGNTFHQKEKKNSAWYAQKEDALTNEEKALVATDLLNKSVWIIDSGATQHMTSEKDRLTEYIAFDKPSIVHLGDNRSILAFGQGTYHIVCDLGNRNQAIALHDVLYLPDLDKNLLSVRAMIKLGATVEFKGKRCEIARNGKLLAVGNLLSKLYLLQTKEEDHHVYISQKHSILELWHYRYGHLGIDNIKELMKGEMVYGISNEDKSKERSICESCIMGKQHRTEYPKGGGKRATNLMELVHSDVCGPILVNSFGDSRYFVTFIDDFSRYTYVYFIKRKSEVLEKFQEFVNHVTNLTGKPIKVLRTDNGGEYCSKEFESYLKQKGISHQLTAPYSPAQNGVSERMNRTLVESATCMMHHASLPREFWAESVSTAAYLRNRSPNSSLKGITPYEVLFNQKPNVSHLKVFGCLAFLHIPTENRRKFEEKSRRVIFVGYPAGTKGYKLYDPLSKRFIRGRDVMFAEKKFYEFSKDSSAQPKSFYYPEEDKSIEVQEKQPENDEGDQIVDDMNVNENAVPGQQVGESYEERFLRETENLNAKRIRRPPRRFDDECYIADNLTEDVDEPLNIKEAWTGEHANQWKKATDSEYDSLINNGTWELVPPPNNKNIVGSRWVFKVKHNSDGTVNRFKARLVAQGYSQSEGIDYQEVFSPVVRNTTIRSLLAVANIYNWEIHQMDVHTAFLQGELQDEIYMKQPSGYVDKDRPEFVCKLKKSIYGLKQAARCWNTSIDTYLTSNGYKKSTADPCVYVKSVKQKEEKINFVIMAIYVDDMLWFSNNSEMLKKEKDMIAERFKVDDLGEVKYVLGMVIERNRKTRTLSISQPKYLEGILKRFGMDQCKPVTTPMETGMKFESLSKDETPVETQRYQMAIGCLTYAATATRPDISSAVGILSKFMSRPSVVHWQGVKRILRYLKGTLDYGLLFTATSSDPVLSGYSDADWGGDIETRRSTSGYVFQIQNNTVSWRSKRQTSVSRSTTEAEYIALSLASQEIVWLRRLLSNIGTQQDEPSIVFEDNQGAIELTKNPKFHNRTKHVDIAFHFVREQVNRDVMSVVYCSTDNMLADIMTKALPRKTFENFRDMLGVKKIK